MPGIYVESNPDDQTIYVQARPICLWQAQGPERDIAVPGKPCDGKSIALARLRHGIAFRQRKLNSHLFSNTSQFEDFIEFQMQYQL